MNVNLIISMRSNHTSLQKIQCYEVSNSDTGLESNRKRVGYAQTKAAIPNIAFFTNVLVKILQEE